MSGRSLRCISPRIVLLAILLLAIVKLLIAAFDWDIDVETGDGRGNDIALPELALPETHENEPVQASNGDDRYSIQHLLDELGDRWQFTWIKERLGSMWPEINAAGRYLTNTTCSQWQGPRLRIMLLPGVLTRTNFARPESVRSGGPLGELVQWSDLLAACYALCHSLAPRLGIPRTASELMSELDENTTQLNAAATGCDDNNYVDVIFADLTAVRALPPPVLRAYRYKLRVLDVFGTEAIYNDDEYVKSHPALEYDAGWGRLGLCLKQFYTLYRV